MEAEGENECGRRHLSPAQYPFREKQFCRQTVSENQFPSYTCGNFQIAFQLNGIDIDYFKLEKV